MKRSSFIAVAICSFSGGNWFPSAGAFKDAGVVDLARTAALTRTAGFWKNELLREPSGRRRVRGQLRRHVVNCFERAGDVDMLVGAVYINQELAIVRAYVRMLRSVLYLC